jgi:hypothetical protein
MLSQRSIPLIFQRVSRSEQDGACGAEADGGGEEQCPTVKRHSKLTPRG